LAFASLAPGAGLSLFAGVELRAAAAAGAHVFGGRAVLSFVSIELPWTG